MSRVGAEVSTIWTPSDHDPACAALSHDDPDSCSCGFYDDVALDDGRAPVVWCTYPGDQRGILDPANNPVITYAPGFESAFGHIDGNATNVSGAGLTMTMRGPTTMREALFPVVAEFDEARGRTRVGWSYVRPSG